MLSTLLKNFARFLFFGFFAFLISFLVDLFGRSSLVFTGKMNCSVIFTQHWDLAVALALLVLWGILIVKGIRGTNFSILGIGFILGGGGFNLISRLYSGCVFDYFKLFDIYFNVADVLVLLGFALCYNSIDKNAKFRKKNGFNN